MRSLLWIALGLVAAGSGVPQGIERPVTPESPPIEGNFDEYLCEYYNNCPDTASSTEPPPQQPPVKPDPVTEESYNRPPVSSNPPPSPQGGDECQCVQAALCRNSTPDNAGVGIIDIRVIPEGCGSYLETCCRQENIRRDPPKPPNPTKPPRKGNACGNRNPEGLGFRITGDENHEAQYAEFPWMVAVVRPDRTLSTDGSSVSVYHCGGSLIHPQVVMTGAHCVNGKDNLVIRAGEWDTQTKREQFKTQDRNVRQVVLHEQFNKDSLFNDVALLILDQPVDMSFPNVGLICLPEANENMDNRNCVASGWGKDLFGNVAWSSKPLTYVDSLGSIALAYGTGMTGRELAKLEPLGSRTEDSMLADIEVAVNFGKEGKYQVILKRVDLPMVPRPRCQEALRGTRLGPGFKLHESFLCAGGIPGNDTCKGDGGGPLVCPSRNNPDVYVQAGMVAWGIGCNDKIPGVYVNVPHFVNWIHNKLNVQGISFDS